MISYESARVVWPDGTIGPGRVSIEDDRIVAATALEQVGPEAVNGILAPGYVDTHVHAGGGGDFASTDLEEIRVARDFHRSQGTTGIIASIVTDTLDAILAETRLLAQLCDGGEFDGIHLETPFLSTHRCGAHPPALLREPDPATVEQLIEAGGAHLAMITIAPELPGALDAIDRFVAAGVTVAVGHTAGDAAITQQALDHGATVATHLFNAMNPIHHRNPGPVPVLLTDDRVAVELVCDGHHLAGEVITLALDTAGLDRTILVTDAMSAAGLPDGDYRLGTLQVRVAAGRATLVNPDGSEGSIAGSTLTLAQAVRNVVSFTGRSPAEVIGLATRNPARIHGLTDLGRIEAGTRADLIVLDDNLQVTRVMARGIWLTED